MTDGTLFTKCEQLVTQDRLKLYSLSNNFLSIPDILLWMKEINKERKKYLKRESSGKMTKVMNEQFKTKELIGQVERQKEKKRNEREKENKII